MAKKASKKKEKISRKKFSRSTRGIENKSHAQRRWRACHLVLLNKNNGCISTLNQICQSVRGDDRPAGKVKGQGRGSEKNHSSSSSRTKIAVRFGHVLFRRCDQS